MRVRFRPKNSSTPEPGKSRFQRLPVECAFGEEIEIHRPAMAEAQGQRSSSVEAIPKILQGGHQRPKLLLSGREDVTPGPEGHWASLKGSGECDRRLPVPAWCARMPGPRAGPPGLGLFQDAGQRISPDRPGQRLDVFERPDVHHLRDDSARIPDGHPGRLPPDIPLRHPFHQERRRPGPLPRMGRSQFESKDSEDRVEFLITEFPDGSLFEAVQRCPGQTGLYGEARLGESFPPALRPDPVPDFGKLHGASWDLLRVSNILYTIYGPLAPRKGHTRKGHERGAPGWHLPRQDGVVVPSCDD